MLILARVDQRCIISKHIRAVSLSRERAQRQRRRRILDRELNCHGSQRETYFRISSTRTQKASRRPGYVPIVTVTRGLSTKIRVDGGVRLAMSKNQSSQNLGRFWSGEEDFVRRRCVVADSMFKWGTRPGPTQSCGKTSPRERPKWIQVGRPKFWGRNQV